MNIENVLVADTETSGFDPSDSALLEFAFVGSDDHGWFYVEHEGVIPAEAKAVHHIQERDVAPGAPGCLPVAEATDRISHLESTDTVWAFHNAKFDLQFLPVITRPVICTWKCAQHLYPDAPKHGNQVLRYWLGTQPDARLLEGLNPHRAMYDAAVTHSILRHMIEVTGRTVSDLLELTGRPVLMETCNFGKYKGKPWSDVAEDWGYARWIRNNDKFGKDEDIIYTLDVLQNKRAPLPPVGG